MKKYKLIKSGTAKIKSIFSFQSPDDFDVVQENIDDYIWTEDVKHHIEFLEWTKEEPSDSLSFKWNGVLGLTPEEMISLEGALASHLEDNREWMTENPDVADRLESAWNKITDMAVREERK